MPRIAVPNEHSLRDAVSALKAGELVAFPTATVYLGRGETDAFYSYLNRAIDT